jgi:hypothetical protein
MPPTDWRRAAPTARRLKVRKASADLGSVLGSPPSCSGCAVARPLVRAELTPKAATGPPPSQPFVVDTWPARDRSQDDRLRRHWNE